MFKKTTLSKLSFFGKGLHFGLDTTITILPSETGYIRFIRVDVKDKNNIVIADYKNVNNAFFNTTIYNEEGVQVSTIEHIVSALQTVGISSVDIEINNKEVPIMDGSSEAFIFLLNSVQKRDIKQKAKHLIVKKAIKIESDKNDSYISVKPYDGFKCKASFDFYDDLHQQEFILDETAIYNQICQAKTFVRSDDYEMLKKQGMARGGREGNAILYQNKDNIVNPKSRFFENDFLRHKVLDFVGDIALTHAIKISGSFECYKSGHKLNNDLIRAIFADESNYELKDVA